MPTINIHFAAFEDQPVHVASVAVADTFETAEAALEDAYARTQNVAGSWSRGPTFEDGSANRDYDWRITVIAPLPVEDGKTYGHRSTCVGDIFEVDGVRWRVAGFGFKPEAA